MSPRPLAVWTVQSSNRSQSPVPCPLLDLPGEVLSQIASYLPLPEILAFLSLHPTLLSLTKSHLSPLPGVIDSFLSAGPPYPPLLAKLPSLPTYLPDDSGQTFLDLLVRARPKWIIERLEIGRWRDEVWREAFQRRFLPSWKRYKGEDDTWRAVFLRTLGRLEHRNLGCTHEESWTRFVTLHRSGYATINRIYSRLFDPYDIYDELKHQNNFASSATHVRVILHLQDIRIIALGVLLAKPSLFVNPNAHLFLHPPLLRSLPTSHTAAASMHAFIPGGSGLPQPFPKSPTAAANDSSTRRDTYFPLVRSISSSDPVKALYPILPVASSSGSRTVAWSNLLPSRARRASATSEGTDETSGSRLGGILTRTRSRDRDGEDIRRRTFSFGRRPTALARSTSHGSETEADDAGVTNLPMSPTLPSLPELSPTREQREAQSALPTPPMTPPYDSAASLRRRLPYAVIRRPVPASGFELYPNPTPSAVMDEPSGQEQGDRRQVHEEIEDDAEGQFWSGGEAHWGGDGTKMAEWDPELGVRRRWVGPMVVFAQLHPCYRRDLHPPGVEATSAIEGEHVDLGPKGMYTSVDFDDLEVIMPWIAFRGGGGSGGGAQRNGLGFE